MAPITKAELARRFGVDRAQATRWADMGMPVLPGGMVDPEDATAWVRTNVDPSVRQARQRQGYGHISPARREQVEAQDQLMRLPMYWMAQRTPGLIAALAVEIGLSVEVARRLHDQAVHRVAEMAETVREMLGVPPSELGPMNMVEPFPPVDWQAVGEQAAKAAK